MSKVTYEIVEHDGGYAYKVGDVFSETFPSHDAALKAANDAAQRQRMADNTEAIQYQDAKGAWHTEIAPGGDRPETDVEDDAAERAVARNYPNLDKAPMAGESRQT